MSPLTGCTINASTVNSQAKGSHLSVAEPNWKELTRVITGWSVASLGAALFLIWGVFVGGHDRLVVFLLVWLMFVVFALDLAPFLGPLFASSQHNLWHVVWYYYVC